MTAPLQPPAVPGDVDAPAPLNAYWWEWYWQRYPEERPKQPVEARPPHGNTA